MPQVSLIFGAATIGSRFTTVEDVQYLLDTLKPLAIKRIDTAAKYPPTGPSGLSESLLGRTNAGQQGFLLDTKVQCEADGNGSLTAENIERSLTQSLERLGVDKVGSQPYEALIDSSGSLGKLRP